MLAPVASVRINSQSILMLAAVTTTASRQEDSLTRKAGQVFFLLEDPLYRHTENLKIGIETVITRFRGYDPNDDSFKTAVDRNIENLKKAKDRTYYQQIIDLLDGAEKHPKNYETVYKSINKVISLKTSYDLSLIDLGNYSVTVKLQGGQSTINIPENEWFATGLYLAKARACMGLARQYEKTGNPGSIAAAVKYLSEAKESLIDAETHLLKLYKQMPEYKTLPFDDNLFRGKDISTRIATINRVISKLRKQNPRNNAKDDQKLAAEIFTVLEVHLLEIESKNVEMAHLNKKDITAKDVEIAQGFFGGLSRLRIPSDNKVPLIDFYTRKTADGKKMHNNPWLKANILIDAARARLSFTFIQKPDIECPEDENEISKKKAELNSAFTKAYEAMSYIFKYYNNDEENISIDGRTYKISDAVKDLDASSRIFDHLIAFLKKDNPKGAENIKQLFIYSQLQITEVYGQYFFISLQEEDLGKAKPEDTEGYRQKFHKGLVKLRELIKNGTTEIPGSITKALNDLESAINKVREEKEVWEMIRETLNETGSAVEWIKKEKGESNRIELWDKSAENLLGVLDKISKIQKESDRNIIRARIYLWLARLINFSSEEELNSVNSESLRRIMNISKAGNASEAKRILYENSMELFKLVKDKTDTKQKCAEKFRYFEAERGGVYKEYGELIFSKSFPKGDEPNQKRIEEAGGYLETACAILGRLYQESKADAYINETYANALASYADILLLLYQITKNDDYFKNSGRKINEAVKVKLTDSVKLVYQKIKGSELFVKNAGLSRVSSKPEDIRHFTNYYWTEKKKNVDEWEIWLEGGDGAKSIAKITIEKAQNKFNYYIKIKVDKIGEKKFLLTNLSSASDSVISEILKRLNESDAVSFRAEQINGETYIVDDILYEYSPKKAVLFRTKENTTIGRDLADMLTKAIQSASTSDRRSIPGNYREAAEGAQKMEAILGKDPERKAKDPIALARKLDKIYLLTSLDDAEKIKIGAAELKKIISNPILNYPNNFYVKARASLMLIDLLGRLKDYSGAIKAGQDFLEKIPYGQYAEHVVQTKLKAAEYFLIDKNKNLEASGNYLKEVEEKDMSSFAPKNDAETESRNLLQAKLYLLRSKIALQRKNYSEASDCLKRAKRLIDINPQYNLNAYRDIKDHLNMVAAEMKLLTEVAREPSEVQEELKDLSAASKNKSFFSGSIALMIRIYTMSDNIDAAIETGEKALALYKNNDEYLDEIKLELGTAYAERKGKDGPDKAISYCKEILGKNTYPYLKKKAAYLYCTILAKDGSKKSIDEINKIYAAWLSAPPQSKAVSLYIGGSSYNDIETIDRELDDYILSGAEINGIKDLLNKSDFNTASEKDKLLRRAEGIAKNILKDDKGKYKPYIKKQALVLYCDILSRQSFGRKNYEKNVEKIRNLYALWVEASRNSKTPVLIKMGGEEFPGIEPINSLKDDYILDNISIANLKYSIEQGRLDESLRSADQILNDESRPPYIKKQALAAFLDIFGRRKKGHESNAHLSNLIFKEWKKQSEQASSKSISFSVAVKLDGADKTYYFSNIESLNMAFDAERSDDIHVLANADMTNLKDMINQAGGLPTENEELGKAKEEALKILKKNYMPSIKKQTLALYLGVLMRQPTKDFLEEADKIFKEWQEKSNKAKPGETISVTIRGEEYKGIEPLEPAK